MRFPDAVRRLRPRLDAVSAAVRLAAGDEHRGLLVLGFHQVLPDEAAREGREILPGLTVPSSRMWECIERLADGGYEFGGPELLEPTGSHGSPKVLITFDDGYAGSETAIRQLASQGFPSVLFVASTLVEEGKAFWWDVVFRARRATASLSIIRREIREVARLPHDGICGYLTRHFGPDAMKPIGTFDRPIEPAALAGLAEMPLVTLGNHTLHHRVLTFADDADVLQEIREGRVRLDRLTGKGSDLFAYPDGAFDSRIRDLANRCGVRFAFTVRRRRMTWPLSRPEDRLQIGRYFLRADSSVHAQVGVMRAGLGGGRIPGFRPRM